MAYLVSTLWPWVVAAIVLGVVVGALTGRPPRPGETARAGIAADLLAWTLAAVLAAGTAAAILHWLRGRHGLWLDMALTMTAAYVLGCGIGALARRLGGGADGRVEQPTTAAPAPAVPAEVEAPAFPAGPADAPLPATVEPEPSQVEPPAAVPEPAEPRAKKPRKAKLPVGEPPEPAPSKTSRPRRAAEPASVPPEAKSRKPRGKPKA